MLAAKTARLEEKIAKLKGEMQRLEALETVMLVSPDQQISLTDADFALRWRRAAAAPGVVGYNVQVAVETEHHLIVTHEVTNVGSDRAQLSGIATAPTAAPCRRRFSDSPCSISGISMRFPAHWGRKDFLPLVQTRQIRKKPPFVLSSPSILRMTTRSCSGRNFRGSFPVKAL